MKLRFEERYTTEARMVIDDYAIRQALSFGDNRIGAEHLLLGAARACLPRDEQDRLYRLVVRGRSA